MSRNKVYKFKIGVWVNNLVFHRNKNLFMNIVILAMEIYKEIRLEIKNKSNKTIPALIKAADTKQTLKPFKPQS